jgi:hypothetical protein
MNFPKTALEWSCTTSAHMIWHRGIDPSIALTLSWSLEPNEELLPVMVRQIRSRCRRGIVSIAYTIESQLCTQIQQSQARSELLTIVID